MIVGGVPVKVASACIGPSAIQLTLETCAPSESAQEEEAAAVFDRLAAPMVPMLK
jgi:hypothetical protein